MASYIFLFISSLLALYPKNIYERKSSFYSLIFSSIIFSHISLGFISLILIHLNLSKFPLIIIFSLLFLFLFLRKNNSFQKLLEIKNFLKREWEILKKKNEINNSQKSIFIFLLILVTFLFLSSIGPINHPDAADYHVGYPYQYYLRGGFFIDGGLHQGLLGIGDYANLSFIQENNIWLIRSIQIINLPLIILFLSKEVRNNIVLIAFLTVPTFIQWSTIGKPLFLGESSLIILYLIWKDNQSSYNLKLLIITMLSCIAYKISALIIIFPIFIDIAKYATNKINLNNNFIEEIKYIIFSKEILFTIIVLFSIFIERQIIIGNFAFPLLTNIFNNNDLVINEFSKTIMNYQRNPLSFLKIFIPIKISELSTFLGPSILFIYIATLILNLKNFPKYNNDIFFITTSQILLLLLFSQGRADYYSGPLILIIYESRKLDKILSKSRSEFIEIASILDGGKPFSGGEVKTNGGKERRSANFDCEFRSKLRLLRYMKMIMNAKNDKRLGELLATIYFLSSKINFKQGQLSGFIATAGNSHLGGKHVRKLEELFCNKFKFRESVRSIFSLSRANNMFEIESMLLSNSSICT